MIVLSSSCKFEFLFKLEVGLKCNLGAIMKELSKSKHWKQKQLCNLGRIQRGGRTGKKERNDGRTNYQFHQIFYYRLLQPKETMYEKIAGYPNPFCQKLRKISTYSQRNVDAFTTQRSPSNSIGGLPFRTRDQI